jgi:two-component system, chemotaxis family, chemotaxis protein CheY
MKILIVEDDYAGRILMERYLSDYGTCDLVDDGQEALDAYRSALDSDDPYQMIMLDIMLPSLNGQDILRSIRETEKKRGIHPADFVKVIITSALGDPKNIVQAFNEGGADSYLVKPINRKTLHGELEKLGFYPDE